MQHLGGGGQLDDWIRLYDGLAIRRRLAMRIAFTNQPKGKRYTHALSQIYKSEGFDIADKVMMGALTAVLWLGDDQERIAILHEIRSEMSPGERARLNSPVSARRRIKETLDARAQQANPPPRPPTPLQAAKRMIADLQGELEEVKAQLARSEDGSLFDLRNDTAEAIATAVVANVNTHKAEAIAKSVVELVKRKNQRPAG
jgi:hypothetical protein